MDQSTGSGQGQSVNRESRGVLHIHGLWDPYPFSDHSLDDQGGFRGRLSEKALKEEDSELGSTRVEGSCREKRMEKHIFGRCIVKAVRQNSCS